MILVQLTLPPSSEGWYVSLLTPFIVVIILAVVYGVSLYLFTYFERSTTPASSRNTSDIEVSKFEYDFKYFSVWVSAYTDLVNINVQYFLKFHRLR